MPSTAGGCRRPEGRLGPAPAANADSPLPPVTTGRPGLVRRTSVVMLSDGGDEHSLATYADTLGVRAARAFVDVGRVPPELDQGTLVELMRSLRRAVDESLDLALMEPWNAAELGIILDVERVAGSPRRLEGKFVLTNRPYEAWQDENVRIADVDDPAAVAEGLAMALQKVRDMVNDLR